MSINFDILFLILVESKGTGLMFKKESYTQLMRYGVVAFVLLAWGVLFYLLNKNTYFVSDDFRYHFIYEEFMPSEGIERVDSLGDIIYSMFNHYFLWGGRIVAHSLAQLFLMWGKPAFNVINTIAFGLLGLLIYLHAVPRKKLNLIVVLAIPVAIWTFTPQFGMTMLWLSGSANYLYTTLFILSFLLPYRLYRGANYSLKTLIFLKCIGMFLLGIIAGWTNENTGGAMIALAIMFVLYWIVKKYKIPYWSISGILGSFIGFALLLFAPGNFLRGDTGAQESLSDFVSIIREFTLELSIILIGVALIYGVVTKIKETENYVIPSFYVIAAFLSISVMVLSPERPSRTLFGAIIFLIIGILNLINLTLTYRPKISLLFGTFVVYYYLAFIPHYQAVYLDIKATGDHIYNNQYAVIIDSKNKGNLDVVIDGLPFYPNSQYNPYWRTANFTENTGSWFNSWAEHYFGVNSISLRSNEN